MIVRISSEGQYRLDSSLLDQFNEMDSHLVDAIAEEDTERFETQFQGLIEMIREQGTPIAADELVESHVIVPRPDITFEEARAFFTGDGVFPNS